MEDDNAASKKVIGCAIEVHRHLGPGLLESVYEEAMAHELGLQGVPFQRQVPVPMVYKGRRLGEYRLDLLVDDSIIVEVKAVERYDPLFEAQVLTYLRLTGKHLGLLINFNTRLLKDGVRRFVL